MDSQPLTMGQSTKFRGVVTCLQRQRSNDVAEVRRELYFTSQQYRGGYRICHACADLVLTAAVPGPGAARDNNWTER